MKGEAVEVKVGGESVRLPVSMAALGALGRAQVCPIYLSSLAALSGRPLVLTLDQVLTVIALGLSAAGVSVTREKLWQDARQTDMGCRDLNAAALDYLTQFCRAMPEDDAPPPPAGGEPPKA
jgi:hypothetical protein